MMAKHERPIVMVQEIENTTGIDVDHDDLSNMSGSDVNARMMATASTRAVNRWLDTDHRGDDDDDNDKRNPFIVGDILKFNKGEFEGGKEKADVPLGTRMVVDPDTYVYGRQRWEGDKLVEHRAGWWADYFKAPKREALGFHDRTQWDLDRDDKPRDPGDRVVYLTMHCEDDPEKVYTFTSSSGGGRNAVRDLKESILEEAADHKGARPIIELGLDSCLHTNKSKVPVAGACGLDG
jgi:hypothetical protein